MQSWLASDDDALYTRVKLADFTKPENGYFYILGLLMDVEEFSNVWEAMNKTKNENFASRTTNGMHYFELKDAKVIVEKY